MACWRRTNRCRDRDFTVFQDFLSLRVVLALSVLKSKGYVTHVFTPRRISVMCRGEEMIEQILTYRALGKLGGVL
jgi:hypothetical protein